MRKLMLENSLNMQNKGNWCYIDTDFSTSHPAITIHGDWTLENIDGVYCMQSNSIPDNANTDMTISIDEDIKTDDLYLTFEYDCSSEGSYDYLNVIQGDREVVYYGAGAYSIKKYGLFKLDKNLKDITFRYLKDGGSANGRDNVRIFNLSIVGYDNNYKIVDTETFLDSSHIPYIVNYGNFELGENYIQSINQADNVTSEHNILFSNNGVNEPMMAKIYYYIESESSDYDYFKIYDSNNEITMDIAGVDKLNTYSNEILYYPLNNSNLLFKYRKDGVSSQGFDGIRITKIEIIKEAI